MVGTYQSYLKTYKGKNTHTFISGPKELVMLFRKSTIKKLSPAVMELVYNHLHTEGLLKCKPQK